MAKITRPVIDKILRIPAHIEIPARKQAVRSLNINNMMGMGRSRIVLNVMAGRVSQPTAEASSDVKLDDMSANGPVQSTVEAFEELIQRQIDAVERHHRFRLTRIATDMQASTNEVEAVDPPSSAILAALLPIKVQEDVIGNLEEIYLRFWVPKYGARRARWIWWSQTILTAARQWLSPIFDVIDRIKKLGGVGS